MKTKLTDKLVTRLTFDDLKLPAGQDDGVMWSEQMAGFGVRLRRGSDHATYHVAYRYGGRPRTKSLGDVSKISLEDAMTAARQVNAKVTLGLDPNAERDAARQAAKVVELKFGAIVARYLADKAGSLSVSSRRSSERYLRRYAKRLHSTPIDNIKRNMVATLVRDVEKEHGRASAHSLRKVLSAVWSWALREGLAEGANVVINTNVPALDPPRDRVLSDDELRAIWRTAEKYDDDFTRVIRLLLLSGMRREEIGGLVWAEVNLETGKVSLPAARTKNRRPYEAILPPAAVAILSSQPRREDRKWVFGRRGNTGMSGWSYCKAVFDRRVTEISGTPLAQWGIHDLRRSAATRLGDLGVAPHVIDAVLGHAKETLHRTYNKSLYAREAAQALAMWADKLAAIVEGRPAKIIPMTPKRKTK